MAEETQIIVDTNVVSDVLYQDPQWYAWSSNQLLNYAGRLIINPLIYAEICYRAASRSEADDIVERLGLDYRHLPREALYLAAKAFQTYRKRGGAKTAPLADFFIGAHAEALGVSILTRDKGRYSTYFPTVTLVYP